MILDYFLNVFLGMIEQLIWPRQERFELSRKTYMWRLGVECLFESPTSGLEY